MKEIILVTGSIAYDRIMNFPGKFGDHILPNKIHDLSISFLVDSFRESFGGTAGNIAFNLGLLDIKNEMVGRVGNLNWASYKKWCTKNRMGTRLVSVEKSMHTAAAHIITDQNDNQITGFYPGAMAKPIISNLKSQISKIKPAMVIVSPQHPVDMVEIPKLCRQKKIKYIFDPGQQTIALTDEQLRSTIAGAYILIGNDYELAVITKRTGWSMEKISELIPVVIVTMGAKGSIIMTEGRTMKAPAAKVKSTIDPTGAGDAYRAGLIYAVLQTWPWEKIGQFAGIVAAYTVEKEGTQTHTFTRADIAKRYRQNFGKAL